ncbi:MAG: LysM peptidoglycan-binding domain-containing protein, partial [Bacteroidales bacterium]|nr:LysM peptidoglycan-binding domain-containing protein [Bacteroidales bacterium]
NDVLHTVRSGDTLYSIARHYGCTVSDLRQWNPGLSDAIKAGQTIRIGRVE